MIPPWAYLDEQDRATFGAMIAFLEGRLTEQSTIDWALGLKPAQRIERLAIDYVLNWPGAKLLDEPWGHAWRLIEESWSANAIEEGPSTSIYGIQERLRAGDRSGAIISAIVDLVSPRLKVEPIDSWQWRYVKKPRHPKKFDDLISARLTSGDLIDMNVFKLAALSDIPFLSALANALDAAVSRGLDIARRIGWDGRPYLLGLGDLRRVYYVASAQQELSNGDPDAYHHGIAPATKLLYTVVRRITDLDVARALPFVQRWQLVASPVHTRLWAASARNSQLVPSEEVGRFLLDLDDRKFWDLHLFPEIAELRAIRFPDLDQETQNFIVVRLQKGPPRDHWPKKAKTEKVKDARLYWAARELKRIGVAGGTLPPVVRTWLEARTVQFADLTTMTVESGFPEGSTVRSVPPNPDDRYNTLEGAARLRALETAFSTSRGGWDDDPAKGANDWLRQPEKTALVLVDLEATGNGGDEFPGVWDRFGWAHSPRSPEPAVAAQHDLQGEAERVLGLLIQLSERTLSSAIEGISNWLDSWGKQVVTSPLGLQVWLQVWPVAVEATNNIPEKTDEANLSVTASAVGDDREPMDLDTLNTPAGKLVGVFLSACPSLLQERVPFAVGTPARQMRDAVITAAGRSGLIARHRLIEALPYFLRADRSWAEQHLIGPLNEDSAASLALWRAVARGLARPPNNIVEILGLIGERMAERATDRRLGRNTRRGLVFRLVVESLQACRAGRNPAVPNSRITQMLRTLDDEVRASAANAIQQFVREISTGQSEGENAPSAADLFRSAAAPFLRDVWPQERSLATPGVSGALSDLPATSGDAFAEAVDTIERFLVPFDCWSMINYGLYGVESGTKKLAVINDNSKAEALLRLLNLTIGSAEGAVVPHDLTNALDQIRSVSPNLAETPTFRRLATLGRR